MTKRFGKRLFKSKNQWNHGFLHSYTFIFQVKFLSLGISLFAFLVQFIFSLSYFFCNFVYFTPRHNKSMMSDDSIFYTITVRKFVDKEKKNLMSSQFSKT